MGGESSRRTKARHGPNPPCYVEESEEEEVEEEIEEVAKPQPRGRRGGRRQGKEPATSQYAPHLHPPPRQAPYMMRSMSVPRATARTDPRARGAAFEICPRTPDRLIVEFGSDQITHPHCPKRRPQGTVEGFAIAAPRDYQNQSITIENQRAIDVYRYQKNEGLERRFWCDFHKDFYASVIIRKDDASIVPMKYIDWEYFENMNDPSVNAVIAKFEEYKLGDLMGFKYN
ncbi:putative copia-like retroelement [Panicum miliaceum]|uniref:Copia-like retroelement n=1 Tax=Panicum miliaceum TaxID=4540 RepID=A0A3L6Q1D7_PANMI|nr:putative copia-like retroelement [Panicum miliaceum]